MALFTVLGSLILLFFSERIWWMLQLWMSDGLYSFCAVVPLVSGVLVYLKRSRLNAHPPCPAGIGLLMVGTAVGLTLAIDIARLGFYSLTPVLIVLAVSGLVLGIWGWGRLRHVAFPLGFLLFMVPLPPAVFASIDYPLQIMCAVTATTLSHAAGIAVHRLGTMIVFSDPNLLLNIAPACNGVRSSLAMIAVGVLYAYVVDGPWTRKMLLVMAGLPLAYFANFVRLFVNVCLVGSFGSGFMKYEQLSDYGFGFLVFGMAVAMLFLVARCLGCSKFREIV